MGRVTTRSGRVALGLVLGLTLGACSATYRNHGYVPLAEDLDEIVVGVSTQSDVEATVGRPTTGGVMRDDSWYYVQSRIRQFGPARPEVIDRELVAVSFAGEDGTVTNIERFGLRDGRPVALSRRVTKTTIREFGLIQQLLRNFGRIDVGEAIAADD
jgi:outer membrane protein assembly factor BamE (lipoprotein component of BamABCDE complex)